ncbi:MAG: hypothetical protein ABWY20_07935 [Mycobacterium sp.]
MAKSIVPPSGSGSENRIKGYNAREGEDLNAPASVGEEDVVKDRRFRALAGVMLHRQLKKNKSTGIKGWK